MGVLPPYLTAVAHTKGFELLRLKVWSLRRAGRVLRVHLWVRALGTG